MSQFIAQTELEQTVQIESDAGPLGWSVQAPTSTAAQNNSRVSRFSNAIMESLLLRS